MYSEASARLVLCTWATLVLILNPLSAGAAEDRFDRIDRLLEKQFGRIDRSLEEQYRLIDDALEAGYRKLAREVAADWGSNEVKLPSRHEWVDYDDHLGTRRTIDFETGIVRVERLVEHLSLSVAREVERETALLLAARSADLAARDKGLAYARQILEAEDLTLSSAPSQSSGAVLAGLVSSPKEGEIAGKVARTLSPGDSGEEPLAGTARAKRVPLKGRKSKIVVDLPMKPDFRERLANRYLNDVRTQAVRYQIQPSLLLAVMETESHFNPRAMSAVPAFGLMQLVPRSGAMDAYEYIYGQKTLLEPEYLFQASRNVELGAAYLYLLKTRYLRKITDPQSLEFCMIAAYNTGSGNVARAFTGTTATGPAVRIINGMTSAEVYDHLLEFLPFRETRHYLRKVTDTTAKYKIHDTLQSGVDSS